MNKATFISVLLSAMKDEFIANVYQKNETFIAIKFTDGTMFNVEVK